MTARMDPNNEKPPDKNIQKQSPSKILGSWWILAKQISPKTIPRYLKHPEKGGFFVTLSSIVMVQWKIAIFAREKHIGDTRNFSTELLDYPRKKSWKLLGSCLEWRFPGYEHMIPPPPEKKGTNLKDLGTSEPACLQHRIGDRCLAIILAFCHSISGVLGCFQQLLIAGKITFLGTITLIPTSKPALLSRWCMDDAWFFRISRLVGNGFVLWRGTRIHNLPLFRIWLFNFTPEATQISTYFNPIFRNTPLQKPRKEAATHQNKTKTLENKLLLISIHFTLKTSHSCLLKKN